MSRSFLCSDNVNNPDFSFAAFFSQKNVDFVQKLPNQRRFFKYPILTNRKAKCPLQFSMSQVKHRLLASEIKCPSLA